MAASVAGLGVFVKVVSPWLDQVLVPIDDDSSSSNLPTMDLHGENHTTDDVLHYPDLGFVLSVDLHFFATFSDPLSIDDAHGGVALPSSPWLRRLYL